MLLAPALERSPPCVGRFRLRRRLGAGLQGTVYLAQDPDLDRPVAVKLLFADAASALQSDEGRNLGRLQHPNIVSIFESGRHRGHRYLVFEYVDGQTLADRLKPDLHLPAIEALPLFRRIVEGIAYAHTNGVLHLDLNPNNVMIDRRGVPRIMDFGLSRRAAQVHAHGVHAGAPRFMAPEQFDACVPAPHTDVYALGLLLFRMLTGRNALQGESIEAIAQRAREGTIDFSLLAAAETEDRLEMLVRDMLAPSTALRIPSGPDLLRRLDAMQLPHGRSASDARHGTVEFLLRRMRLKKELPGLSATLMEVNRLTAENSVATSTRLAQVVLRDYALANRLLRLANSAYFGNSSVPIATVSEAIVRLGFDQVRTACNALLYVGRLQASGERNTRLFDRQVEGFVTGLIARHLGKQAGIVDPESAFLCGMFRGLGETLAAYCFSEECDAIEQAVASGSAADDAFAEVLGLDPCELGAAIGREWKLPTEMTDCMAPLPTSLPVLPTDPQRLHALVALAEALAKLMMRTPCEPREASLARLAQRFDSMFAFPADTLCQLAQAAGEKFRDFESVIGLKGKASPALWRLHAWLDAS